MPDPGGAPDQAAALAILAPAPLLTITIERAAGREEVHVHAGGQGFWVARLAAALGAEVTLCAPFGGETGRVVADLLARTPITLAAIETTASNGAYVHDRRGGQRRSIAVVPPAPLDRHAVDDLFGATLAAAVASGTLVVTASSSPASTTAPTSGTSSCTRAPSVPRSRPAPTDGRHSPPPSRRATAGTGRRRRSCSTPCWAGSRTSTGCRA